MLINSVIIELKILTPLIPKAFIRHNTEPIQFTSSQHISLRCLLFPSTWSSK